VTFTNNSNTGVATGVLTTTIAGSNPQQISLVSDTCAGSTVNAGGTCVVTVRLVPTGSPGPRSATITVSGTPGNSTTTTLNGSVILAP
jgi:hypothetical protein